MLLFAAGFVAVEGIRQYRRFPPNDGSHDAVLIGGFVWRTLPPIGSAGGVNPFDVS
jgi:hypothetical protein